MDLARPQWSTWKGSSTFKRIVLLDFAFMVCRWIQLNGSVKLIFILASIWDHCSPHCTEVLFRRTCRRNFLLCITTRNGVHFCDTSLSLKLWWLWIKLPLRRETNLWIFFSRLTEYNPISSYFSLPYFSIFILLKVLLYFMYLAKPS